MQRALVSTALRYGSSLTRRLPSSFWRINLAVFDQALVSAVNFATGLLTARFLGTAEFGRYVLAFSVVSAANIFQQALVVDPMLSIGSKKSREVTPYYFSAVLLHQAALSFAMALLMLAGLKLAAVEFPTWNTAGLEVPLLFATLAFQWQELIRRYFFVRGRIALAVVNDGLRYGTQLVAILALMRWRGSATTSSDILLVIGATATLGAVQGSMFFGVIRWRRDVVRSSIVENWRYSRWLVPSAALRAFNLTVFFSTAGYLRGAPAAADLRAAQNLVAFLHILYFGLESITLVKIARVFATHGVAALRAAMMKFAIVGGLVTFACLAVVCLNVHWLLSVFYSGRYQDVGYLVYLWAVGYGINFFALCGAIAIRAMERTKHIFIGDFLQMLFAIVSVYPLLKYLGLSGAVVSWIGASLIALFYFGFALLRTMRQAAPALQGR